MAEYLQWQQRKLDCMTYSADSASLWLYSIYKSPYDHDQVTLFFSLLSHPSYSLSKTIYCLIKITVHIKYVSSNLNMNQVFYLTGLSAGSLSEPKPGRFKSVESFLKELGVRARIPSSHCQETVLVPTGNLLSLTFLMNCPLSGLINCFQLCLHVGGGNKRCWRYTPNFLFSLLKLSSRQTYTYTD